MNRRVPAVLFLWIVTSALGFAADPPTGFQDEVVVENPTRLPWEFVAQSFGPDAAKLPGEYNSRRQRYQLFVPAKYTKAKSWPLIVFISPGDDPLGWKHWQKICEESNILFCAAFGAGNSCPVGQRVRIVLDILDDVRRHYRIDPDETYLTGFSGGGRMACTLALSMPEFFGGVIPVCGTNPPHKLSYLNHRAAERVSVALITGEHDFNRTETEEYMQPLLQAVNVRTKLWVVPNIGHFMPGPEVLREAHAWLAEDLKRRRADAKTWPGLAASPDDVPTAAQLAKAHLDAAEIELKKADRTWRGVALLQGVVARWPDTDAGDKAKKGLDQILKDAKKLALVEEQGGKEERKTLMVQGEAFEKLGDARRALQAFTLLSQNHPNSDEGKKAAEAAKRLSSQPYLGVVFTGEGMKAQLVMPKGPADLAGMKNGDMLVKLGALKVATLTDLRQALATFKTGDKTTLEVQRGGKAVTLSIELAPLAPADK